jgi:hypothetical protein
MARRAIPVALVVAAAAADGAGAHGLAFYALFLAVPAAAAVALDELGDLLDGARDAGTRSVLWGLVLSLTVVGAAARAPDVSRGLVPTIAHTTLLACLGVFCLQAGLALAGELRRR